MILNRRHLRESALSWARLYAVGSIENMTSKVSQSGVHFVLREVKTIEPPQHQALYRIIYWIVYDWEINRYYQNKNWRITSRPTHHRSQWRLQELPPEHPLPHRTIVSHSTHCPSLFYSNLEHSFSSLQNHTPRALSTTTTATWISILNKGYKRAILIELTSLSGLATPWASQRGEHLGWFSL